MDEGNVRPHAGQQGDGTVHRVGLTRHCIASGIVQLPFALRDTLPEGELLALDAERDEAVVLEVVPPRGLAGLADFFAAHDLQVNDRLEIRIRGRDLGEVRLVAVRSARRPTSSEDRPMGAADRAAESSSDPSSASAGSPRGSAARDEVPSPLSRPKPAPLPDTSVQDALDHGGWSSARASSEGPGVVETIGSVTVRRLGAGRFAAPAATTLARRTEDLHAEAPSARDARLGVSGRTDDAPADALDDADAPDEPLDAPAEASTERAEPTERPEPTQLPEPADAGLDALLVVDDAGTPTLDDAVRQPSLFAPRDAVHPPVRPSTRRRPASDPATSAPATSPRGASTPAPSTPAPSTPAASPPAGHPRPEAVQLSENDLADPEVVATVRQRAREEELSRAGDLRSRIVRWLLAPTTPVIVPIERVQHAFDLPVDVAREVVEGVLEEPPPSLRLTRLREGLLRVSRVTVEHDA